MDAIAVRRAVGLGARTIFGALPEPVPHLARSVYRALRPAALPPARRIEYPPDVADEQALRDLLAQTDVFEAPDEARAYLDAALERFRVTMALLPPLAPAARVLELGANPYFFTRLLRARGFEVRAANWFGDPQRWGARGVQRVVESGVAHEYAFDHFNVEADRFPYDDASFDLVLFCEILEHLPFNPTHTLAEIHRVLKPDGTLLLTTPNAARLENLAKAMRGENMYEPLSGHGVYGRHNREYTVAELRSLLEECGFAVDDLFALDIWFTPETPPLGAGVELADRGENLFALARPAGQRRWPYPSWLYYSLHGYYGRLVRPDLVVGVNCVLQAAGVHEIEPFDGRPGRWTNGAAKTRVLLAPAGAGSGMLRVEGRAPHPAAGESIVLCARVGAATRRWTLPCDGRLFSVAAPVPVAPVAQEVELWTDRAWRPSEVGVGDDGRLLGVVLHAASLDA